MGSSCFQFRTSYSVIISFTESRFADLLVDHFSNNCFSLFQIDLIAIVVLKNVDSMQSYKQKTFICIIIFNSLVSNCLSVKAWYLFQSIRTRLWGIETRQRRLFESKAGENEVLCHFRMQKQFNSKQRPHLNLFDFPSIESFEKNGAAFALRAHKEFQSTTNLYICSQQK